MEIIVEKTKGVAVQQSAIEIVERKGLGHPDTLCDRVAEELSIAFSRYYLKRFGRVLHHNIDKCLLVGGRSAVCFGGGEMITPIQIIVVGRAVEVVGDEKVPLEEIARETTHRWLKERLRFLEPEKNVIVETKIRTGSVDLRATFDSSIPLANDTSIGVGFSPLTETESLVYHTEQFLNSAEVKQDYSMIGEDIKIMGIRVNDRINLTIAMAFVSRFISSKDEYFNIKKDLLEYIRAFVKKLTSHEVTVAINAADNYEKNIVYLTVTGTSAECGDDGQVGRGNRANGLITPYRPMTLEATAGKNPITHTGKLYNLIAGEISAEVAKDPDIAGAECYLVSQIGMPITEPQIVHIKIHSSLAQKIVEEKCRGIIKKHLDQIPQLWKGILERRYSLF
ncbi:MAG: methionine adenosyltransferase [Candidatus Brocadia sp. AMX2]|uniref:S-adenosylmethionine synthetase n=1 Tax=Candidatus Brocadia sinica JPN1 TaxID=1197129 RepID=A0ABQ0JUB7_9BACT|nr:MULTISPECIES: methionine adenosyltransferase [Brocadia]MBC6932984.1 methionine adenosyltransferase [Candidatus Brocadia sp.]MBL1169290.1 methionine adenosyltransferase [Candidatus Brocadia sp. AMX1]MCK6467371.1 methionine adenosyltransferase [Candidatus Brocadia sinica]NOG41791.1 methionine adenosyltransferase [Planctomycetota bacterium]MCE7867277.1 methionine adenosyltransferase [Candidatus Brocadia sp. AMX2]